VFLADEIVGEELTDEGRAVLNAAEED